jgi:hypothetical protein
MIALSLEFVITGFIVLGLILFLVMWFYYDRRNRLYGIASRRSRAFHCSRCGRLYESREPEDPVACPTCGGKNPSLRF